MPSLCLNVTITSSAHAIQSLTYTWHDTIYWNINMFSLLPSIKAQTVSRVSQVMCSRQGRSSVHTAVNYLILKLFYPFVRCNLSLAQFLIIQGRKCFQRILPSKGLTMMKPCDESIKKTFKLVEDMLGLADEGDAVREDTGCGVLYGVIRDSAYKIKKLAEAERDAHIKKGWWKE